VTGQKRDRTAIEPLRQESKFDVKTEMMTALERIEDGAHTQMPMWMRLTQIGEPQ